MMKKSDTGCGCVILLVLGVGLAAIFPGQAILVGIAALLIAVAYWALKAGTRADSRAAMTAALTAEQQRIIREFGERGETFNAPPNGWVEFRSRTNTKIAGVTKYRKAIDKAAEGDVINLVREPHNQYDSNAIAVHLAKTGKVIGYINRDLASRLSIVMDAGSVMSGEITAITGGGKKERGVNIAIWTVDAWASSARP